MINITATKQCVAVIFSYVSNPPKRLENMRPEPIDFPRFFRSVLGGVI